MVVPAPRSASGRRVLSGSAAVRMPVAIIETAGSGPSLAAGLVAAPHF